MLGFGEHPKKQLVDFQNGLSRITNLKIVKLELESPDMVLVY